MIEFFGEVTGDHVCSNTEWEVLQLKKAAVTDAKIKELEGKKWFQVLTQQYKHLLSDANAMRLYVNTVLEKLKAKNP